MNKHESGMPFGQNGGRNGYMSIVIVSASSGTAQLQKLGGNDPDNDTWVDVTNGLYSASGEDTIYAPVGQPFRFVLTGDAQAYSAG